MHHINPEQHGLDLRLHTPTLLQRQRERYTYRGARPLSGWVFREGEGDCIGGSAGGGARGVGRTLSIRSAIRGAGGRSTSSATASKNDRSSSSSSNNNNRHNYGYGDGAGRSRNAGLSSGRDRRVSFK